jgi:Ni,Fe-hydrogenase III large subunit
LAEASHPDAVLPPYQFLQAEGPSLHQIPVGPVHAGIIEPGHFRFTASGETVVRLEERLGYTHKGIEKLLAGKSIDEAARLAARVSGDSTVAYSLVFARALEAALESPPPPRALWLRAVMAELERIANHLGDVGAICNDAAFSMMHAECGILREETLRACASAFGHRLMMDCVVPGGVAADLKPAGAAAILALTQRLRGQFPELVELYENTASLQDRTVGTGVVSGALAAQFAAPGYVGRASGRAFDARICLPYPPYDAAPLKIAARSEGDVDARVWVRIQEIQHSIGWLERALASLPAGPAHLPVRAVPAMSVEGAALVEGFRGDILGYVRIGAGRRIERCHLRDPSWLLWPLLEAAIEGNIVADFPLCNKSFNCSYSGHDL